MKEAQKIIQIITSWNQTKKKDFGMRAAYYVRKTRVRPLYLRVTDGSFARTTWDRNLKLLPRFLIEFWEQENAVNTETVFLTPRASQETVMKTNKIKKTIINQSINQSINHSNNWSDERQHKFVWTENGKKGKKCRVRGFNKTEIYKPCKIARVMRPKQQISTWNGRRESKRQQNLPYWFNRRRNFHGCRIFFNGWGPRSGVPGNMHEKHKPTQKR